MSKTEPKPWRDVIAVAKPQWGNAAWKASRAQTRFKKGHAGLRICTLKHGRPGNNAGDQRSGIVRCAGIMEACWR